MKKFFICFLYVLACVVLLDLVNRLICDYTYNEVVENSRFYKRNSFYLNNDTSQIIILGASRAYRHYNPKIFKDSLAMTCSNYGYDATGTVMQYIVLQKAIERKHLKVAILDISDHQLSDLYTKTDVNLLKSYYWKDNSIYSTVNDIDGNKMKFMMCSSFLQYHSKSFVVFSSWFLKKNSNVENGFNPLEYTGKKVDYTENDAKTKTLNLSEKAIVYLNKIVKVCNENNVQLYICCSPTLFNDSTFVRWMANYCDKMNVQFINYSSCKTFTNQRDLFSDPQHLNCNGAETYSAFIAHNIVQVSQVEKIDLNI